MPAPIPTNADALNTSMHFVRYAGAIADTNLVTEGGNCCRAIRAASAGDLVVRRASDNALVTLPFAAGETQVVGCNALVAAGSSIASGVTVFW